MPPTEPVREQEEGEQSDVDNAVYENADAIGLSVRPPEEPMPTLPPKMTQLPTIPKKQKQGRKPGKKSGTKSNQRNMTARTPPRGNDSPADSRVDVNRVQQPTEQQSGNTDFASELMLKLQKQRKNIHEASDTEGCSVPDTSGDRPLPPVPRRRDKDPEFSEIPKPVLPAKARRQ